MINLVAGKLKPAHPPIFIKLFTETGNEPRAKKQLTPST